MKFNEESELVQCLKQLVNDVEENEMEKDDILFSIKSLVAPSEEFQILDIEDVEEVEEDVLFDMGDEVEDKDYDEKEPKEDDEEMGADLISDKFEDLLASYEAEVSEDAPAGAMGSGDYAPSFPSSPSYDPSSSSAVYGLWSVGPSPKKKKITRRKAFENPEALKKYINENEAWHETLEECED